MAVRRKVTRRKAPAKRKKKSPLKLSKQQNSVIWGIVTGVIAALLALALAGELGALGVLLIAALRVVVGYGVLVLPLVFAVLTIGFLTNKKVDVGSANGIGLFLLLGGLLGCLQLAMHWQVSAPMAFADAAAGGGYWGGAIAYFPHLWLGALGGGIVLAGFALIGGVMAVPCRQ